MWSYGCIHYKYQVVKDQIVSFETAKLAKEKGYNYAYEFYDTDGNILPYGMEGGWDTSHEHSYAAPTQSLLQKWLREEHQISVEVDGMYTTLWRAQIFRIRSMEQQPDYLPIKELFFDEKTYEEALEKGLQEALTLI